VLEKKWKIWLVLVLVESSDSAIHTDMQKKDLILLNLMKEISIWRENSNKDIIRVNKFLYEKVILNVQNTMGKYLQF